MLAFFRDKKIFLILWLFIFIGIILRFYNLNWGAPYYFHPDERNIASAISQLQFPKQMDPHFFAYGSLPIYLVYLSAVLYNYLSLGATGHWSFTSTILSVSFEQAIIGLRILSATLSVLLIPLLYAIGKNIKNERSGLLAAFFATTSIGFIQYAHFGTYEMFLTFFTALLFLLCLSLIHKPTQKTIIFTSIVSAILLSSKVTNLLLLPVPLCIFCFHLILEWRNKSSYKIKLQYIWKFILSIFVYGFIVLYIFILTNPFVFQLATPSATKTSPNQQSAIADSSFFNPEFLNSMHYESSVALGTEPVFYTGEFINTLPVIFQGQRVLPFLLTPFLMITIIPAIGYMLVKAFAPVKKHYILLCVFLAITFLAQAFFFVKWTRYMVPSLPFFYAVLVIFITEGLGYIHFITPHKFYKRCLTIGTVIAGIICCVYTFAFFITVYVEPDTREAAAQFADQHIAGNASILSEVYDLGITTFNANFSNITLFNFYDLDNQSPTSSPRTLAAALKNTDYIILPSQRILKVRLQRPKKFPNGNAFYKQLIDGKLGFQKIYETPCDIWCTITYAGNPVNSFEETANVFDRPTLYIFKRQ